MKKTKISVTLAAAAVILCLCGVFFCTFYDNSYSTPVVVEKTTSESAFSLDKAKQYLSLCSVSYYPESLEAKLKDMGNTEFKYLSRDQDTTSGSGIAFSISTNKADDNTTVTAVFRGTNKGEWYSNFNVGEETEHSGFSAAADFAMEEINNYLKEAAISKASANIAITGHSRGGAVANLVASRFIDEGEFREVSAYTFASPNTTTANDAHDSCYNSIYNIQNPEDFICYIPLSSWSYTKYGIVIDLPEESTQNFTELFKKMENRFLTIAGYKHTGYPHHHQDINTFLLAAEKIAPTVQDYYNREISIPPHRVTLYKFMTKVAALLSDDDPLANGMFILSSGNSPLFEGLTDIMMQGIDIEKMAEDKDLSGSAIAGGHTYETYRAWMDVLDDDYFKNKIDSAKQQIT